MHHLFGAAGGGQRCRSSLSHPAQKLTKCRSLLLRHQRDDATLSNLPTSHLIGAAITGGSIVRLLRSVPVVPAAVMQAAAPGRVVSGVKLAEQLLSRSSWSDASLERLVQEVGAAGAGKAAEAAGPVQPVFVVDRKASEMKINSKKAGAAEAKSAAASSKVGGKKSKASKPAAKRAYLDADAVDAATAGGDGRRQRR